MDFGTFDYEASPALFLGRVGSGPMHMAWDTNTLIEYLKHGARLWSGVDLGAIEPKLRSEVEAIGRILDPFYIFWDIRIHLFEEILSDAKRELSIDRYEDRERALERFARALEYAEWDSQSDDDEPMVAGDMFASAHSSPGVGQLALFGEPQEVDVAFSFRSGSASQFLESVPAGHDRLLVAKALDRGMHVFITHDRKILRNQEQAKEWGLLLVSAAEFCERVDASGIPVLNLPAPDLGRISKLIGALRDINGDLD